MSPIRIPVILDVDTGVDDAVALALALRDPRCDLLAVTTLAGNVDVERTTRNTLAVLDHLGGAAIPVHRGASRPLARPHRDATYAHGTDGLGAASISASDRPTSPDRGPAAIIRLATARPGEVTLVCAGPLTNLAIALNVAPNLGELLRWIVVMGGAFRVGGNVTRHAEFNAYCDPEAFAQVISSGLSNLTLIGLDVTHQTAISRAVWESIARADDPTRRLIYEVCRDTFTDRGRPEFYLHDPLALSVALDPSLVGTEPSTVSIRQGGTRVGQTRVEGAGSVNVAFSVDARRVLDEMGAVFWWDASSG